MPSLSRQLTALTFFVLCLPTFGADWPQWRGPNRDDISLEKGLLKQWPGDGPKLAWSMDQGGIGYSSFAVVGDRLYTLGSFDGKESVYALATSTGKKVWEASFGTEYKNNWGDGPRGTPTVDGTRLYAIGGQGDLVCLERDTGNLVWKKSLTQDLGGRMMSGWGYTESPLVDGDRVICTPGGAKGTVAALDKKTGEVIWRSKGFTDAAAYSSLVVSNAGNIKQYVQMTGDSVAGVAADDGRMLWRFPRRSPTAAIPTPLVRDSWVYVSSGYGTGAHLIQLTGDVNGLKAAEVYASKEMENHHGGVILLGDHVYGHSKNGWTCQELQSGKVLWKNTKVGKGSVTCADGMLYLYSERDGTVALVEATASDYKEVSRFKLPRQTSRRSARGAIWTHPVVANGKLYLRDQDLLFCYDVKGP